MFWGPSVRKQGCDLATPPLTTLFAGINYIENRGPEMCQCGDGLHLNRVSLLQRMVQDPGGVNDLPTQVLVVRVSNVQRLGRESVGLDFNISSGNLVDETRFANIGKSTDEQSPGIGINGWKTTQMLSDLLKVGQALALPLHYGGHPTKGSTFKLLASIERVAILQETNVVLRNVIDLEKR